MSNTYFIDMDGTIVKHNYTPLETPDVFLPGVIDTMKEALGRGDILILTTNRPCEACWDTLVRLNMEGIKFRHALYNLPVGVRTIVNDSKNEEIRAKAVPVERDRGLWNLN